jgi:hypothetical protein
MKISSREQLEVIPEQHGRSRAGRSWNELSQQLMGYIEKGKAIDRQLHRRPIAGLKKAQAEFPNLISELGEYVTPRSKPL